MNFDRVNKWLTLGANIGVLFGILFLAIEIQQYQVQLAAQSRFNYYNTRIDGQLTLAIDPHLVPILVKRTSGIELTPEESYRLTFLSSAIFTSWRYEIGEYLEGRIDFDDLDIPGKHSIYVAPQLALPEEYLTFKSQRDTESPIIKFMEQYVVNP